MTTKKLLSSRPVMDHNINSMGKSESNTLSVYEIIKLNMSRAQRAEFLFQTVYIGTFNESLGHMTIYKMLSEDLDLQNDGDYNSSMTGLLLMYSNCFINNITCTQDILYSHLRKLLHSGLVSNLKILHYHPHTTQSQFKNWYMLFVTPLIAKESNLNFQGQKDHPVQQEMGTSRIKNTTGERGDGTIQGKNSSAEISADEILTVFDQFNELCSYLEVKSSGYLQVSETERRASEVSHLIPTSHQVLLVCEQSCLRDVEEILVDYHQIRHAKFHTDDIWPLPASCNAKWGASPSHTSVTLSPNEEDDQSTSE